MSFSVQFFARDVHQARMKLQEAYAPAAVKAAIELAIAGVPAESSSSTAGAGSAGTASNVRTTDASNRATPAPRRLCGILVETHGHIDECGGRSGINVFRVEPYYD